MRTTEESIQHALETIRTLDGFEHVRFIILYGSVAEGQATETSDIDLCIYYHGTREEGGAIPVVSSDPFTRADLSKAWRIFSHFCNRKRVSPQKKKYSG